VVLLPEPIDANHTQLEARLSYGGEKLHVSAGYYASFYSNNYGSLRPAISSSLNNPVGSLLPVSPGLQGILGQPLALAPDNQAQQLDVSGSYSFSPTTQGHFKVAYSQAVQDQNFAGAGLTGAPTGVSNLGGRVDTTLVQLGLSSRPLPKLALSAKLRYEDTDDKTPLALYNVEGDAANNYTNRRLPLTRTRANLLASYQLSADYRGSLGADFETIDRGVFTASSAAAGISALRQKTDETTVKAELRHTLTETFSGAVSVSSSRRDGSNWLKDNSGRGVTEVADPADPSLGFNANAIFMPTLANRERDKLRVRADWQPSADLSIQFAAEDGADRYRTPSQQGLRSSGMNLFSLDWDYALTDNWHVNGYASTGGQRLHQSRPEGYVMSFGNLSNQAGLGITGKASSKIEVGGTFAFVNDRSRYEQALDPNASANSVALLAAAGGLPDIVFRQTTLNLFSKVTLDKKTSLRFDVIHHRSVWNDWAWNNNGTPFVYADGSTVNSQPKQVTTFLGVSYIYRWL
jgi:MtrB/PioB family decaheme-associated outer membrane protein